jgi:hypothetical protein
MLLPSVCCFCGLAGIFSSSRYITGTFNSNPPFFVLKSEVKHRVTLLQCAIPQSSRATLQNSRSLDYRWRVGR